MCAAMAYEPEAEEKKFNDTINAAVEDFNAFSANKWKNPSRMDIHLFTNFSEFFDFVIDVKKAEIVNAAAAAAATATIASAAPTPSVAVEPLAKRGRQQQQQQQK